ncbi:hypothetical protein D3C85_159380 [compost metagenome]
MNNNPKDVSLFVTFKDPDEASESGLSSALDETDTGKVITTRMHEICKWIPTAFDADKDPLWPKFDKVLDTELFETRYMGDEEFVLVWRDVAFTYYKRFGRSTYVSRELTDDEATQFIMELRGTLENLAKAQDDHEAAIKVTKETAKNPPTAKQLAKAAEDKALADKRVADHDVDPEGHYTLHERRMLLATAKGYTATLRPILTLDYAESIISLLEEEGIPHAKPVKAQQ